MPEGMPPLVTGFEDDDQDTELEMPSLEEIARLLFSLRNNCALSDVDNLLAHPDLQQQFDEIMDHLAVDTLTDVCPLTSDKDFIDHLEAAGLVNPTPIRIKPGVGVSTHRPYHRERALATQGQ